MLTILIGVLAGAAVFIGLDQFSELHYGWNIALGFLAFIIVQIAVLLILRLKMKTINQSLQAVMAETQKNMERKQQIFIRQRNQNQTMLRMQLEAEQKKGIEEAVKVCERMRPLCLWNLSMKKQIATLEMAFYYQIKDWKKVDELLPDCIYMDPQTISMRLARMYKTKDANIEKFYKRKTRRLIRKEYCVLPAAVFSWILLKQDRKEDALKVLNHALKKTSSDVLARNRDAIINGKLKQFSNADLAESWYVLALEEPKMQRVQQRVVYR